MESFLKDTPLETHGNPSEFRSFIEPSEAAEDADSALEANVSENPETVEAEPAGEAEIPSESEPTEQDPAEPSTPETPALADETEVSSPEIPSPDTAVSPAEPAAETPATEAGTGEVVFEQVDGPKVEVISEDGTVSKIIVHLAPDKILELKCEY